MASIRPKISTTVRLYMVALRMLLRALSAAAPALAARIAERLWFTPGRAPVRAGSALPPPRTLRAGGLELPVWTFGDGPPVYLVHGWGGRADQLAAFIDPLAEAGHRVVLFDGPGHGRAPGRFSSGPEIARALRTAAELHGSPHAVIAHSFGAAATALAINAGLAPGRVVLLAPPAHLAGFLDRFGAMVGASAAVMRRVQVLSERRLGIPWSAVTLEALAGRQTAPALVIHDRQDREVAFEEGEAVARTWPGAQLVATTGLGHWRVLRDPEVIGRVVRFVGAPSMELSA
jgi:pimeloyl-ACP methyl ester carboxylesterase